MRAYNEKMMKMAEKADQSAPVLMYQDGLSMNTIWAVLLQALIRKVEMKSI